MEKEEGERKRGGGRCVFFGGIIKKRWLRFNHVIKGNDGLETYEVLYAILLCDYVSIKVSRKRALFFFSLFFFPLCLTP